MIGISRERVLAVAKEVADQLQVIENVKALQSGQKELADAIKSLNDRIKTIETELRAQKAETLLEALKQTQTIVNSVQGGLNQRIETLAIKVAVIEAKTPDLKVVDSASSLTLQPTNSLAPPEQ